MKNTLIKILTAVAYAAMIAVNYLANALPINNRGTGQISEAYANLFAPAGLTFSIWGLIYLLLGIYVVYQFLKKDKKTETLIGKINPLFIATSLANIAWIIAWHYDYIGVSVVIMVILLVLLIKIADLLRSGKFSPLKKLLFKVPFSIYFGWITVAAIANVTVFLVSLKWDGFGMAPEIWTMIILLVGAAIGIARSLKDKCVAYSMVLIWAYLGILYKHLAVSGFNAEYPGIIATLVLCLISFSFITGILHEKNSGQN